MGLHLDDLETGMRVKFYTNDDSIDPRYERYIGCIGTITSINNSESDMFPVCVNFDEEEEFYISLEEIDRIVGDAPEAEIESVDNEQLMSMFVG